MTFVNGKIYSVASTQPLNETKARSVWGSLLRDPKSGERAPKQTLPQVRPTWPSLPRSPAEVQRNTTLSTGSARAGAVCGERHSLLRGCHRKTGASPPPRGGLPARPPPAARSDLAPGGEGAGAASGREARTAPRPTPAPPHSRGSGGLQTHLPWAPEHSTSASLSNPRLKKGTKEPKRNSSARGDREPPSAPAQIKGGGAARGAQLPGRVPDLPPPNTRELARYSPRRSPWRGGTQTAGSSVVVGAAPGSEPLHANGGTTPQLLSASATGGSWGHASPARGRCLAGAEALPARRAGTPAPLSSGQGGAPTVPPSARCRRQLLPRLEPMLQPLGLPLPPPPSPERVAA